MDPKTQANSEPIISTQKNHSPYCILLPFELKISTFYNGPRLPKKVQIETLRRISVLRSLLSYDYIQITLNNINEHLLSILNYMVDTIYTIEEAAAVLKIKPRTVRSWIDSEKIKAFHLGDLVRIHEDDLQAVIDQARRGG